jgi:K+-sensing histidine kinase KdpD
MVQPNNRWPFTPPPPTARSNLSFAMTVRRFPTDALTRPFQPFSRGAGGLNGQGWGLGLFIASEIAKAHRGALSATSSPKEILYTFRMSLGE